MVDNGLTPDVLDDRRVAGGVIESQVNGRLVTECLGQDYLHSINIFERFFDGRCIVQRSLRLQGGMESGFLCLASSEISCAEEEEVCAESFFIEAVCLRDTVE